jgi:1,4-dihydroxy-2-naphthoyl-CoA synthase
VPRDPPDGQVLDAAEAKSVGLVYAEDVIKEGFRAFLEKRKANWQGGSWTLRFESA